MTRPWGKLHASTLNNRKFIRSTPEERGAWVTLLLYALNSTTDDDLGTADDVVAMLRREGFPDPAAMLQRLVELGWIERDGGNHVLHDWSDWQPDDPTGAKRKRALRAVRGGTGRSQDVRGTVTGRSADSPPTDRGLSRPRGEERQEERILPLSPSKNDQRPSRSNGRASFDDLLEGDDGEVPGAMVVPSAPHVHPGAETLPATEGEPR
jgi:hypothetical protein